MKEQFTKEVVFSYLSEWDSFEDKSIIEEGEAYKVVLCNDGKKVTITTPYEIGEFLLDFEVEGNPYYSDWFEIMDDPIDKFMEYTKQVATNFLFNEVRVLTQGWWIFKTNQLEFLSKGIWRNVF